MLSYCYNGHNNTKNINSVMIMTKNRLILNKTKSSDCNLKSQKVTKNLLIQKSNYKCWLIV